MQIQKDFREFGKSNSTMAAIQEFVKYSIYEKLDKLPSNSYAVCIYIVPEKFRKVNEEAYTPRLVSIGPLHHGRIHLQAMEDYKLRCLHGFLNRFVVVLDDVIKVATELERSVRQHYQSITETESSCGVFTEMILLDGIFIVDLFLKNYFPEMRDRNDKIYTNQWMRKDLLHDMMLLENQLPSIVPEKLLEFVKGSLWNYIPCNNGAPLSSGFPFLDLAHKYFNGVGNTANLPIPVTSNCFEARHLVEFLRHLHRPSLPRLESQYRGKFEYSRSATELQEAGVKFKTDTEESCLFNILFTNGVLTIPHITVNEWTETFFRNLIAFEQCERENKNISSYIIIMDSFVNTPEDVDLLVQNGIIENLLGESEKVADLFNNLHKETITDPDDFYFAELCDHLNEYSRDWWHEWKAAWFKWKLILKRNYFGNPWSIISVIAAIVLLILTVIQTVFSTKVP
uniref:Uncharacterized protein n=1 Tax=Davidia involucrata TaxID=16924 RepID=A0A5B7B9U0_DAVIN